MALTQNLGIPVFAGHNVAFIVGTTDGTANTALDTKPTNPFGTARCIAFCQGAGVYVYDAGTSQPWSTGITATTVDVRATTTSAPYIVMLLRLSGGEATTIDWTGTVT